jgi:hypothetical protein
MNAAKKALPLSLLAVALWAPASGQEPNVDTGAVMKYTGLNASVEEVKQSREFLSTLEAQLAASFARSSGVEYIDRSNLAELFREHRLSSGDEFNPSTGPLKGLLGKLDYLIVIEASGPDTARLRIIDVETGSVKSTSVCSNRSAIARLFSTSNTPECISSLVDRTLVLAKGRLIVKRDRVLKEADQSQKAEKKVVEEKKKRDEEQRQAELKTAAEQEEVNRRTQEEEQNRQQAEAEVSRIKPRYEDVTAKVSSEDAFWEGLDAQLRSSGHSLRPEIRSLLNSVHAKANRCEALLANLQAADANACLNQIDKQLDELDHYK